MNNIVGWDIIQLKWDKNNHVSSKNSFMYDIWDPRCKQNNMEHQMKKQDELFNNFINKSHFRINVEPFETTSNLNDFGKF